MADSRAPAEQRDLDALFLGASEVRILDDTVTVLRCNTPGDIRALHETMRISGVGGRCMCGGDATLWIDGRDGSRTSIGLHHGTSIRWNERWTADARLAQPRDFAEFLATRGWSRYRDAMDDAQQRASEDDHARRRWIATMPAALRPMQDALVDLPGGAISVEQRDRARALLVSGAGSEATAVRTLLTWYGSGKGPWSGFPAYESVAEDLLMTFPVPALIAAIDSELDHGALAGAIRHCAGWHFRKLRKKLPAGVVEKLRAHVELRGEPAEREAFAIAFRRRTEETP